MADQMPQRSQLGSNAASLTTWPTSRRKAANAARSASARRSTRPMRLSSKGPTAWSTVRRPSAVGFRRTIRRSDADLVRAINAPASRRSASSVTELDVIPRTRRSSAPARPFAVTMRNKAAKSVWLMREDRAEAARKYWTVRTVSRISATTASEDQSVCPLEGSRAEAALVWAKSTVGIQYTYFSLNRS